MTGFLRLHDKNKDFAKKNNDGFEKTNAHEP